MEGAYFLAEFSPLTLNFNWFASIWAYLLLLVLLFVLLFSSGIEGSFLPVVELLVF